MLKPEERFVIKEYHRQGLSISEIARRTGRDRKTVRRVLKEPVIVEKKTVRKRKRKIEPYIPYLEQRIRQGVLNAQKLYLEIKKQGYPGKERQVRSFVQPYRQKQMPQATVRFETEPGQQVQVDWAYFGTINHRGRRRRLYAFVMTLGWSRSMYLEFTISMQAAWFLRAHLHAFDYFGGVPTQVLHDNLKTAVLEREVDGTIHWNSRYLDFADYYGFRPRACQPYRAQTKGKVENGIKYIRGNFWPGLEFIDLADLNRQALEWLNTVATVRRHGTTRTIPFERLSQEKLTPLDKPAYDTSIISYRRSSRDCLISYQGNFYSVPAAYAGQRLLVKETEQEHLLIISVEGAVIAEHNLADGRGQRVVQADHYQALWPKAQPQQLSLPTFSLFHTLTQNAPSVEVRPLSVYDEVLQ